jgi:hypothetical protein
MLGVLFEFEGVIGGTEVGEEEIVGVVLIE